MIDRKATLIKVGKISMLRQQLENIRLLPLEYKDRHMQVIKQALEAELALLLTEQFGEAPSLICGCCGRKKLTAVSHCGWCLSS